MKNGIALLVKRMDCFSGVSLHFSSCTLRIKGVDHESLIDYELSIPRRDNTHDIVFELICKRGKVRHAKSQHEHMNLTNLSLSLLCRAVIEVCTK